jgi:hypothetical protein
MSDTAPREAPRGKTAQAEAGQETAQSADGQAKPDLDEVKRRFRAALDRKREVNEGDGSAAGGRDAGRIHGTHDRAGGRRSFRRKSG